MVWDGLEVVWEGLEVVWGGLEVVWGGLGCFGVVWGVSTDPRLHYIPQSNNLTFAKSHWSM